MRIRSRSALTYVASFVPLSIGLLLCGLGGQDAFARSVTFAWDYTTSGAAGFVLYCGPSSGNYTTAISLSYGGASYFPVPADYDGDGRTDIGVYEGNSGTWSILLSSSNYTTTLSKNFGGVVANVRALCRSTSGVLHAGVRQIRVVLLVEHRLTPPGSWVPDQPILTGIGNSFMGYLRHRMFSVRFIECDGYTATWAPSPAFPPTLSLNRAKRVCHELQRAGGTKARVRLIPHGLTNPIATNSTESGRRVNRRVFVTIVHAFVFHS